MAIIHLSVSGRRLETQTAVPHQQLQGSVSYCFLVMPVPPSTASVHKDVWLHQLSLEVLVKKERIKKEQNVEDFLSALSYTLHKPAST